MDVEVRKYVRKLFGDLETGELFTEIDSDRRVYMKISTYKDNTVRLSDGTCHCLPDDSTVTPLYATKLVIE